MIRIIVNVVLESLPILEGGKVRVELHVVEVVLPLVASPPAAAGALPRSVEPVWVEARQDGDVCGVYQRRNLWVLGEDSIVLKLQYS